MRARLKSNSGHGFTLKEVFVVTAVVALLAIVFLASLVRPKEGKLRVECVNNLKLVGLAFRLWSSGGGDKWPMAYSTNQGGTKEYIATGDVFRHFQCISNEIVEPGVPVCPADTRKPARSFASLSNSNISYFVGVDADETMPQMVLAGDRNLAINGLPVASGLVTVKSKDVVSWTAAMHNGQGNAGLADGSVLQLLKMNGFTGTNVYRLAIP